MLLFVHYYMHVCYFYYKDIKIVRQPAALFLNSPLINHINNGHDFEEQGQEIIVGHVIFTNFHHSEKNTLKQANR